MDRSDVVRFGPFTFDRARGELHRGGQPIPIGGRGAALLGALAKAGGQVVTRGELLDAAWPGQVVEERNLTVQIAALRKAMGELPERSDPIRTVARVGYRLVRDGAGPMASSIVALRPSVAVLPFANLTPDPELAFFADGVTEDVIAALSRFQTFAVVAHGSSFACRGRSGTTAEAAAALGVRYVLEGSVRREGRRLRVGARLTDEAGAVVWADRFEDELGGVFEMQDRIAASVVSLAEPRITRAEVERSRRKQPENLDAYDHFIRGMACIHQPDASEGVPDAMVHHFGRAVALDPSFPQALACAGWAHEMRSVLDLTADNRDDFAAAMNLCDRAETQAGDDAFVLAIVALGRHGLHDDGEGALALAERAVALNPNSYDVLDFAATVHMLRARSNNAIELFERCLQLSPTSPQRAGSLSSVAFCHLDAGRYAEAADWEARAQAIRPNPDFGLATLIAAQAMDGQVAKARINLDRFLAARPGATLRKLLDSLPPGSRGGFERAWSEGLRRAGLQEA